MLKQEHLDFTINRDKIKPRFLTVDDPVFTGCAEQLQALYREAAEKNMQRKTLEELTTPVIRSARRNKTAAALNRILLDAVTFSPAADLDYPNLRRERFAAAAKLLLSGHSPAAAADETDIYGDLPDFEKAVKLDDCSISVLLDRYNMAQAQGLLFNALNVTLTVSDPETAELRRVMKAVKFFRLLAHFRKKKKDTVIIEISGSCELFSHSAKYAVAIASILPVVSRLKSWQLEADLRLKNRLLKLKLSDKNPLRTEKRAFSTFIPGEIGLFHRYFAEKSAIWQITGETPFIDAGEQEIIFPDLSFISTESGRTIHLELFHHWHAAQLEKRLQLLHEKAELPLAIGIDRSLVKNDDELAKLLSRTPELAPRCFLFRDFPGVASCCKVLSRLEQLLPQAIDKTLLR